MAVAGLTNSVVLRCDLGWEDVREVMETSRLLTLMRRSWMVAGFMFTALLAESVVLLRPEREREPAAEMAGAESA